MLLSAVLLPAALVTQPAASPAPTPVAAPATSPAPAHVFHVDAEVDPTAYVFDGYSLHVGLGYRSTRLDLGAFAMDVPQFFHGNPDFSVSAHGFGLKLHQFWFAEQAGFFTGVDFGLIKQSIERNASDRAVELRQFSAGVHLGYRFVIAWELYVTPWIGVSYSLPSRSVTLDDATYSVKPITVFPAIHVGWRFQ